MPLNGEIVAGDGDVKILDGCVEGLNSLNSDLKKILEIFYFTFKSIFDSFNIIFIIEKENWLIIIMSSLRYSIS